MSGGEPNAWVDGLDPLRIEVLRIFAEAQHLGTPPRRSQRHQGLGFNAASAGAPRIHASEEDGRRVRKKRSKAQRKAGLPALRGDAHPKGAHRGCPARRYADGERVGVWTVECFAGKHPANGACLYEVRCACGTVRTKTTASLRHDTRGCRRCARWGPQ